MKTLTAHQWALLRALRLLTDVLDGKPRHKLVCSRDFAELVQFIVNDVGGLRCFDEALKQLQGE